MEGIYLFLILFIYFRERGREEERERNTDVREKCPLVASRRCPQPRHVP